MNYLPQIFRLILIATFTLFLVTFFTPSLSGYEEGKRELRNHQLIVYANNSYSGGVYSFKSILQKLINETDQTQLPSFFNHSAKAFIHQTCIYNNNYYEDKNHSRTFMSNGPIYLRAISHSGSEIIKSNNIENNLEFCTTDFIRLDQFIPSNDQLCYEDLFANACRDDIDGDCKTNIFTTIGWRTELLNKPNSLIAIYVLSLSLAIALIRAVIMPIYHFITKSNCHANPNQ